jgi:murein DD-endopeptidase MepM/ murein hydrolase activator NlpD
MLRTTQLLVLYSRVLAVLLLAMLIVLNSSLEQASAQSNGDECSEAYLRDVGAVVVNCAGDKNDNQCSTSPLGVTAGVDSSITWGAGVWGAGASVYRSGLSGPYTIEQWAIHVLKNISIKSGLPESQLVNRYKVISLIAWAKAEGGGVDGHNGTFNPLNTKLNAQELGGSNQGNSTTDSNSNGFPSFDQGVEATTRALFGSFQKRIGSAILKPNFPADALIEAIAGDFYSPNGVDVINRLENIYPDDKAYATLSITGFDYGGGIGDRAKYVSIKRDTLRSIQEDYESYAGKILDGSPAGTPEPLVYGSGGIGSVDFGGEACEQTDGGGAVTVDGYSFPLEPQTKAVGGIIVGQTSSTHWDETDAFDLFSGTGGAAVYSIYSGIVDTVVENFKGIAGCSTIQFKADDGFYYWYGHLRDVIVEEGAYLQAGVKMAEIADAGFGTTCTGGGDPHLHIDRGCSINGVPQRGGNKTCRDPAFIPLLSKIYETLP